MNRSRASAVTKFTSVRTERVPRNVSLALRSINRQHNMESILVKGPNDPPSIRRDVTADKVVEVVLTSTTLNLTYANIYALLDIQTTPFFTEMRVNKVSVFGPPSGTSIPTVGFIVNEDGANFVDRGVGTARTPCLHVRLPESVRIRWTSTTSTNAIGLVTGNGAIVQISIQVRADTPGGN